MHRVINILTMWKKHFKIREVLVGSDIAVKVERGSKLSIGECSGALTTLHFKKSKERKKRR